MIQRSLKEKINDKKKKKNMTKEFIDYYSKNIDRNSKPLDGLVDFLKWAKSKKIVMAICTNKQEKLANDLLTKLGLIKFFDFVAGSDTFDVNKPDARHLTNVVEILNGNLKKTIMVGDSEVDEMAAINAKLPFILIEGGYTGKTPKEIKHDYLIKDFVNFDKIINNYL